MGLPGDVFTLTRLTLRDVDILPSHDLQALPCQHLGGFGVEVLPGAQVQAACGVDLAAHVLALAGAQVAVGAKGGVLAVGCGHCAQVEVLTRTQAGLTCALIADLCSGHIQVTSSAGDQHACGARDIEPGHAVNARLAVGAHASASAGALCGGGVELQLRWLAVHELL